MSPMNLQNDFGPRYHPGSPPTRRRTPRGNRRLVGRTVTRCEVEVLEPRHMLTDAVPNFGLVDVTPASATYNQTVSPRDYLGQVSGYYFVRTT
jgi:hypothetical protein